MPLADQEALHFASAEVVDVGVPVLMEAFLRVGMLVQRSAVEPRHAVGIGREMRRDPIDDDADAGAVTRIDEAAKALGRPEAPRRREQPERLISPGTAERMFGNRHQFDMAEPQPRHIGHQPLRQLIPVRGVIAVRAEPGCGVHFVNGDRRVNILTLAPLLHPGVVMPDIGCRSHSPLTRWPAGTRSPWPMGPPCPPGERRQGQ